MPHDTPYQLTFDDAVEIWLRHWQGEYQHRIAASYDVNPGRVNEVLKGRRHAGSEERAEQLAARGASDAA
ncbi:hypothetical protein GVN18_38275 [Pseudomonas sp. ODNR1LW]|nr:hypothetical protein [Pseudomonas sp. ODNR1LW]